MSYRVEVTRDEKGKENSSKGAVKLNCLKWDAIEDCLHSSKSQRYKDDGPTQFGSSRSGGFEGRLNRRKEGYKRGKTRGSLASRCSRGDERSGLRREFLGKKPPGRENPGKKKEFLS